MESVVFVVNNVFVACQRYISNYVYVCCNLIHQSVFD